MRKLCLVTTVVLVGCMDTSAPTLRETTFNQPEISGPAPSAPVSADVVRQVCSEHALVTFVIDDGSMTDYTVKKPIFDAHRAVAVSAIVTTGHGPSTVSDDQLREMQAAGWEIASHSRTHPDLTKLTTDQLESEIGGSKAELQARGFAVTTFVYPYGRGNPVVARTARHYYAATAQIGWGLNKWRRRDPFRLGREIFGTQYARPDRNSLAFYESQVDSARRAGRWLIYAVHELIGSDAQNLNSLLDYIQAQAVPIVTISQGLAVHAACRDR